jgi:hypothetical protein
MPYGQDPARYYINKRRSHLDAGLVLKPGLESQEGNRSPGFYSRIYGTVPLTGNLTNEYE